MRRTTLVFMVFVLSGTLWAADPIIGTWILSSTKTAEYEKSLNLTPPDPSSQFYSRKEIYKELESGLIELTLIQTVSDGSAEVSKVNQRFVIPGLVTARSEPVTQLNLVVNWLEELKRLVSSENK
jgi:hypothetical protein